MAIISRWNKLITALLGSAMVMTSAELPANCCQDNTWLCWAGGALLGAAAGAGTGYAAGHRHGKTGKEGKKGDKGARGDVGVQGIAGNDGLVGTDGTDGEDGDNGQPGQSGCNCPSVDTQTELVVEFTSNNVTDPDVTWFVDILDPQRTVFFDLTPQDMTSPTEIFTIPAGTPKLTGTYLIRWIVSNPSTGATQLGDVIFNGVTFSTPVDVWNNGDEFDQYVEFP